MALVRSNFGASGKLGGIYFHRDKSGLHIAAMPRIVKKPPSDEQKKWRLWYYGLKREERYGGPLPPDEPVPKSKTTGIIYQLHSIYFERQNSFTMPDTHAVDPDEETQEATLLWINSWWWLLSQIPGLTKLGASEILFKLWWRNFYTYGMSYIAAKTAAQNYLIETAYTWLPQSGLRTTTYLWFGALALLFVSWLHDFYEKKTVNFLFPPGCSLFWLNEQLYWSRLVSHPTKKAYDFLIGPPLPMPTLEHRWFFQPYDWYHNYNYIGLYQTVVPHIAYWSTYTWLFHQSFFVEWAYFSERGLYRVIPDEHYKNYANVPVGWTFSDNPWDFLVNMFP